MFDAGLRAEAPGQGARSARTLPEDTHHLTRRCCAPLPVRSVLLKDSFVESFPPRDRAFMRQFVETQLFSVYSDAILA